MESFDFSFLNTALEVLIGGALAIVTTIIHRGNQQLEEYMDELQDEVQETKNELRQRLLEAAEGSSLIETLIAAQQPGGVLDNESGKAAATAILSEIKGKIG